MTAYGTVVLASMSLLFICQDPLVSDAPELTTPHQVLANGEPIDVDIGHAAPFFTDWDGDGLRDLLVGQFGEGKLRIYRNIGTRTEPKFSDFFYFQAASADGTVPSS